MEIALRQMMGFTRILQYGFYYGLMFSAGVVLLQLVDSVMVGAEYRLPYDMYRQYLIFTFYSAFGIRLCLVMLIHFKWKGIHYLLIPWGWVLFAPVYFYISSWASGALVSIVDVLDAGVSLVVYAFFYFFLAVSLIFRGWCRFYPSFDPRPKIGAGDKQLGYDASELSRSRSLSKGQKFLLMLVSAGLIIDSAAMMWQSSPKWLSLRFDSYFLSSGYFYGHEFFIPVFFNLLAVVLIFRGWPKSSFWLPYLLIFLSYRAFTPPWEGWLPTPVYILWVDRALVVLILVNTAWSLINWIQSKRGTSRANA